MQEQQVGAMTSGASNHAPAVVKTAWLGGLRRYLGCVAAANLAWETAQLPLYAIWTEGTPQEIAFAVAHCTAGDLLIALSSLIAGLVIAGDKSWPAKRFWAVAGVAVAVGVAYTIFSEWLNLVVRESWAYSDLMPIVPILGTGLSPLAQWTIIPLAGLVWARQITRSAKTAQTAFLER